CSSIRKNQVPQPSTDTNDILLKMLYAIAKGLDQNIGALHATSSMLDKDAHATPGGMGSLWLLAPWRVGVLAALARLLGRDVHTITPGGRRHTQIASSDSDMHSCQPVALRRNRLWQPEGIVMMSAPRPPQQDDQLVRERQDRLLQRMPFFFHGHAPVVWH